jgi:hypothetical protein
MGKIKSAIKLLAIKKRMKLLLTRVVARISIQKEMMMKMDKKAMPATVWATVGLEYDPD